jgi:hypothetical protein
MSGKNCPDSGSFVASGADFAGIGIMLLRRWFIQMFIEPGITILRNVTYQIQNIMNKKQTEQEIVDDYNGNPIGMIVVIAFGVLAMVIAFTCGAMYVINWIVGLIAKQ